MSKAAVAVLLLLGHLSHAADGFAGSLTFHDGGGLRSPDVVSSSNGHLKTSFVVDAYRVDSFISFTTRGYYHNGKGSIPGPTLRVHPGDTLSITLTNNLRDTGQDDSQLAYVNGFHSPNTTGLFLYGVRVDPTENSAVIRVAPGTSHTYSFNIPSDHPIGLYWYMDPTHGSSALHVAGGLIGALYIAPSDTSSLPAPLDTITTSLAVLHHVGVWHPSHTSARHANPDHDADHANDAQRRALSSDVQHARRDPSADTNTQWRSAESTVDVSSFVNYAKLSELTGSTMDINAAYVSAAVTDQFLVNGAFQPMIFLSPGEMRRLDMVYASGSPYRLELEIRDAIGGGQVVADCYMDLVALDGMYLSETRPVEYVPMVAGQRASVLLRCGTPGIYFLQSHPNNTTREAAMGDDGLRYAQNIITLIVSGAAVSTPHLPDLSTIERPDYASDLQTLSTNFSVDSWEVSTLQYGVSVNDTDRIKVLGIGENCSESVAGECLFAPFWGPQLSQMGRYRHTAREGDRVVEQVTVYGRTATLDALYMQAGPFQIVAFEPLDAGEDLYSPWWGEYGDWRDTLPGLPGVYTVRYLVDAPAGEYVIRSTYLANADEGMMDSYWAGPDEPFTIFPHMRTEAPTMAPTRSPTERPTTVPTTVPTEHPTQAPTHVPTHRPTRYPTDRPTTVPTATPTLFPTTVPTLLPTTRPTPEPSAHPTHAPTPLPTHVPTKLPTATPSHEPTAGPTPHPTPQPTTSPTSSPTSFPTTVPSHRPTHVPSASPTPGPTTAPPTPAPTPTPIMELTVTVWGGESLGHVTPAPVASVFMHALGPEYTVWIVMGPQQTSTTTTTATDKEAGNASSLSRLTTTLLLLSETSAGRVNVTVAVNGSAYGVGDSLDGETLGTLFEHGRLTADGSKACKTGRHAVTMPMYFYVQGANMTIASTTGVGVIRRFSQISFHAIFGQASHALCGASLDSVNQINTRTSRTTSPTTSPSISPTSLPSLTPSLVPTAVPTAQPVALTARPTATPIIGPTSNSTAAAGGNGGGGGGGTTSSSTGGVGGGTTTDSESGGVQTTAMGQQQQGGGGGQHDPPVVVSKQAKAAIIAVAVLGAVAIILGAVYYGQRLRAAESKGKLTVWSRSAGVPSD